MIRSKYIPAQDEIKDLLDCIEKLGSKETYDRINNKITADKINQTDEMCMDMYESLLHLARTFNAGSESTENTKNNLYCLASMFRFLAHGAHKTKKDEGNRRFLELISYNPSANTYERK